MDEVKYTLKQLKKLKKDCEVGTQARRDINKKIRALKDGYESTLEKVEPEKQEMIDKIYEAKPHLKRLNIDLRKFSLKELQHHYNTKIKKEEKNENRI
jgi:hypothetical protein